jgi:hypothetical protein
MELVSEVVPGVPATAGEVAATARQRPASLDAGLRGEQECSTGTESEAEHDAGDDECGPATLNGRLPARKARRQRSGSRPGGTGSAK